MNISNLNKAKYFAAASMLLPLTVSAETKTLSDLVSMASYYLDQALLLLMGLAVVIFVWYVIQYFIKEHGDRAEAAQYLLWSVLGFFIVLSLWGLVNIVVSTFNLHQGNPGTWTDLKTLFPQ